MGIELIVVGMGMSWGYHGAAGANLSEDVVMWFLLKLQVLGDTFGTQKNPKNQ